MVPSQHPKRHLDRFGTLNPTHSLSHFCTAQDCDRTTDQQTTLLRL